MMLPRNCDRYEMLTLETPYRKLHLISNYPLSFFNLFTVYVMSII